MPSSHWQVHNSVHCERAKKLKWKMKGAIVYMEVWNTRELVVRYCFNLHLSNWLKRIVYIIKCINYVHSRYQWKEKGKFVHHKQVKSSKTLICSLTPYAQIYNAKKCMVHSITKCLNATNWGEPPPLQNTKSMIPSMLGQNKQWRQPLKAHVQDNKNAFEFCNNLILEIILLPLQWTAHMSTAPKKIQSCIGKNWLDASKYHLTIAQQLQIERLNPLLFEKLQ